MGVGQKVRGMWGRHGFGHEVTLSPKLGGGALGVYRWVSMVPHDSWSSGYGAQCEPCGSRNTGGMLKTENCADRGVPTHEVPSVERTLEEKTRRIFRKQAHTRKPLLTSRKPSNISRDQIFTRIAMSLMSVRYGAPQSVGKFWRVRTFVWPWGQAR